MAAATVDTNTMYGVALNIHEVTVETTMSFEQPHKIVVRLEHAGTLPSCMFALSVLITRSPAVKRLIEKLIILHSSF
jgi:hypothetical protein